MMIRPGKPAKYGVHLVVVGALVFLSIAGYTYLTTPRGLAFDQYEGPADPFTTLRQYLTEDEAALYATMDGQDTLPDLEGKEALLIDGDYFFAAGSDVIDHVVTVIESGMPVVLFGGGYYLLRQRIPDLPHAMAMVHVQEAVEQAPIAATVVKRYAESTGHGRHVYGLMQVQGAALSRGLVAHTLGLMPEIMAAASDYPGDQERSPTGYAWYATYEDWKYYGSALIKRRYYILDDVVIDDAGRSWESRLIEVDVEVRSGSSIWGSNWHNQGIRIELDVNASEKWLLQEYGPTETGPDGTEARLPAILPGLVWESGGVVVHDYSNEADGKVVLYHEFERRFIEAQHVRISNPHVVYATRQGQASTSQIVQAYRIFFAGKVWWWYGSAHTPRLILTDWNL